MRPPPMATRTVEQWSPILKSGRNNFHGSAYGVLENYNLDANTWANKFSTPIIPKNPYTQSRFGGTLGGPILRTSYFSSWTTWATAGIPEDCQRQRASRCDAQRRLLRASSRRAITASSFTTRRTTSLPMPEHGLPVVNPVAAFLIAHPELYPVAECGADRWTAAEQLPGLAAQVRGQRPGRRKDRLGPRDDQQVHRFLRRNRTRTIRPPRSSR